MGQSVPVRSADAAATGAAAAGNGGLGDGGAGVRGLDEGAGLAGCRTGAVARHHANELLDVVAADREGRTPVLAELGAP